MALVVAEVLALYFSPSLCLASLAASAGYGVLGALGSLPVQVPFLTSTTAMVSSAVFLGAPLLNRAASAVRFVQRKIEA